MKLPLLACILLCAVTLQLRGQSIFGVRFDAGRSHPYDVLHTAIDVRFDEARREVIGSVAHRVRSIADAIGVVRFDADSAMRIASVTADGAPCRYRLLDTALEVELPRAARYGDTITIAIDYRVAPRKGLYILTPDNIHPERRRQIWTQGEAEDHHYWVPLYDFPNDRATSEMRITVRDSWKALSNGDLVSHRDNGDGTATWHYRLDRPHSSYLLMMAAGDYLVTRDTVDGIPLSYWTYPEKPERVAPTFASTPDVIRFIRDRVGVAYPWSSYAQVLVSEFMYGGMENTTASTMNEDILVDNVGRIDYNPDNIIAHEAAHQWFGDLVTARDWGHLWLQESFATYMASLYLGHRYGQAALLNDMWEGGEAALKLDSMTRRDPIAMGSGLQLNLYQRGSRMLYMLEKLVGEKPFWRGVNLFLERHAFGNAETADFKNAIEDAAGIELDWFFRQWFFGAGAPVLAVSHEYRTGVLRLVVRQTQQLDSLTGLFRLPLPVALDCGGVIVRDTVWATTASDTFEIAAPSKPRYVIVDEGQTTLKRLYHERDRGELTAQLAAPHMLDRWEAVFATTSVDEDERSEAWRAEALFEAFRREPTAEVRDAIVQRSTSLESARVAELIVAALQDSSIDVRRGAVAVSDKIADAGYRAHLLHKALADSSLRVVAAAIEMLAVTDTSGLVTVLEKWRGVEGRRGTMARSWINAVASAGIESMVDDVAAYTHPKYHRTTRWQAYVTLGGLETTTPTVRQAIVRGLRDPSKLLRAAAAEAARAHLDSELRTELGVLRVQLAEGERASIDRILEAN